MALQLLRTFESECVDHEPGLSFLAGTLEACQELLEHKLPEQELDPLMRLIEATRRPLLSRDALVELHRLRQEMRQPQDFDQLLTPLDTLQVHLRAGFINPHIFSFKSAPVNSRWVLTAEKKKALSY